jgi:hypothetical protein
MQYYTLHNVTGASGRGGLAQKFDSGVETRGPRFQLARRPIVDTKAAQRQKICARSAKNFWGYYDQRLKVCNQRHNFPPWEEPL